MSITFWRCPGTFGVDWTVGPFFGYAWLWDVRPFIHARSYRIAA